MNYTKFESGIRQKKNISAEMAVPGETSGMRTRGLTPKEKKIRTKNKMARKSRKINFKKAA